MYFFQGSSWGLFNQKVGLRRGRKGSNAESFCTVRERATSLIWKQFEILGSETAKGAISRSTFPLEWTHGYSKGRGIISAIGKTRRDGGPWLSQSCGAVKKHVPLWYLSSPKSRQEPSDLCTLQESENEICLNKKNSICTRSCKCLECPWKKTTEEAGHSGCLWGKEPGGLRK